MKPMQLLSELRRVLSSRARLTLRLQSGEDRVDLGDFRRHRRAHLVTGSVVRVRVRGRLPGDTRRDEGRV